MGTPRWRVVAIALFASVSACAADAGVAARAGDFYAADSALSWVSRHNPDGVGRMISDARFSATRERLSWTGVQPSADKSPNWGHYLENARMLRSLGVDVLNVFHDTPPWARGDGEALPRDLAACFRFSRAAAEAFRNEVVGWEYWNEPFYPKTPEPAWEMAAAFKAAALGFRAAGGHAAVLNPSLVFGRRSDYDNVLFASGLAAYVDALNLHVYRPLREYPAVFADLRAAMSRWGMADAQVWVTENGLMQEGKAELDGPSEGLKAHSPWQERLQAEFWVKAQVLMQMEGVARNFFFIFGAYNENGGAKDWGALRRDGTPKPVCAAMSEMMRRVGNAMLEGEMDVGEGVRAFVFRQGDGSQTILHWAVSPLDTEDGTLSDGPDLARTFTLGGQEIETTRMPGYVDGLRGLVPAKRARAVGKRLRPAEPDEDLSIVIVPILSREDFVFCNGKSAAALTKATGRLEMRVWNLSEMAKTGTLHVAGCQLDGLPESLSLPPMGCVCVKTICASANLPDVTPADVVVSGSFNGRRTTPAAMRLKSRHAFLANCRATPIRVARSAHWKRNDSADSFDIVTNDADGSCRFAFCWKRPCDRWCYPKYELDLPTEDMEGADMLAFEARLAAERPGAAYHHVGFIGLDGEEWFRLPTPTDRWTEYQIDLNGEVNAQTGKAGIGTKGLRRLAFGCNPSGTNIEYAVRNARILRGPDYDRQGDEAH